MSLRSSTCIVEGNAIPSVVDEIAMSDESPAIDTAVGSVIVKFTLQVYDGDGDVLTVAWDMDDGITSDELLRRRADHILVQPGQAVQHNWVVQHIRHGD